MSDPYSFALLQAALEEDVLSDSSALELFMPVLVGLVLPLLSCWFAAVVSSFSSFINFILAAYCSYFIHFLLPHVDPDSLATWLASALCAGF